MKILRNWGLPFFTSSLHTLSETGSLSFDHGIRKVISSDKSNEKSNKSLEQSINVSFLDIISQTKYPLMAEGGSPPKSL